MNELTLFKNEKLNASIRIIDRDGNPWFVAKDVCDILEIKDHNEAVQNINIAHKCKTAISPREYQTVVVDEAGLYKLIFKSRTAKAEEFQEWVTSEVLPSIRKTGGYHKQLTPAEQLLQSVQLTVEHERKLRQLENNQQAINSNVIDLTEKVKLLDVKTGHQETEYFSVMGYANLKNVKVNLAQASSIGKECACNSRSNGYMIGKVRDPRFGQVNTYHESVLEAAFRDRGLLAPETFIETLLAEDETPSDLGDWSDNMIKMIKKKENNNE